MIAAVHPIPARGITCDHCDEELRVVAEGRALRLRCPTHGDVDRACLTCGTHVPLTGKRGRPSRHCPQHETPETIERRQRRAAARGAA